MAKINATRTKKGYGLILPCSVRVFNSFFILYVKLCLCKPVAVCSCAKPGRLFVFKNFFPFLILLLCYFAGGKAFLQNIQW